MKQYQILKTIIVLMAMFFCFQTEIKAQTKTEVLVIGTIHAGHIDNPNYSLQDLVNILGTYNPDAICVEIPPSYFRKQSYLKEMMLAAIYGFDNNKKVYPIDWWETLSDARAERNEYIKTDDFKIKSQQADSLKNNNRIMQEFTARYGTMDSIWKNNIMSYEFFNGEDYNDYIREMYTILINVFGDGCMNLYSELRNAKMMELINKAISENEGKRVIVLTGAEHKYYFDIAFSKQKGVKLINFKELLPLKTIALTSNLTEFIDRDLAKGYYDVSNASSVDIMYQGALVPLVHGMGMDYDPAIIPAENVEKANSIIAEWESISSKSTVLQFEKAWIKFLEEDYLTAIEISENIKDRIDEFPKEKHWFYVGHYWRNLGFCYDMTNQREKAVDAYKECIKACETLGVDMNFAKNYIYKNFENEPYMRKKDK
ncbi:MAG: DUF5694 domain-containing protein [Lentimicrobiaceae bacterium]|nr:DUF5694 domain-containing protein [Lentimicrobiaceae bacterium]